MFHTTFKPLIVIIALAGALGAESSATTPRPASASPPRASAPAPRRAHRLDDVCREQAAPVPTPADACTGPVGTAP